MAAQKKFYTLPLRTDEIINKKQHNSCSLVESIAQNLHLIISTYRGESSYSEEYGCSIWDEDFKTQLSIRWKEEVRSSVMSALEKFEPRLQVKDVKVDLTEQEFRPDKHSLRVRRKLILGISGFIRKTNEKFSFQKSLYISPLSQV
jgi:phage baseplate assembly protein W